MYEKMTLGELLSVSDGSIKTGPFGTILKAAEYSSVGTPLISVGEVSDGLIRLSEKTPKVDKSVTTRLPEYVLRHGDIVFGRKGAVDRSAWIHEHEDGYFLGSDGIRVRFGERVSSRFMAYQLRSATIRDWLIQHAAGTTMPSLNQGILERVPIRVPKLYEQQAIAEVLGALDDKIAANDRQLVKLTELIAAEFMSALNTDSRKVLLDEVAQFHNRRRVPLSSREREYMSGSVPYYGAAGRLDFVDRALFDEPLVLVGEDGTVIRQDGKPVVQYIWGPAWVNNHAHVLTGRSISTEILKVALERANVTHLVTGAVQPKISMGNLKSLTLEIPTDMARLDAKAQAGAALVRALSDENSVLTRARDDLLPLLMSGKVRVRDAESAVEGTADETTARGQ